MFPEGTDAATVSRNDMTLLGHNVTIFCREHGITRKALGRHVGYSSSVISEVLNGRYAGDWKTVALDLDRWLEAERKRRDNPIERSFVWTSVAREIEAVAKVAVRMRVIAAVYGPDTAGIGKTMALGAIHRETPGSMLVTCDMLDANPTGLIRAIASAMRIGETGRNSTIKAHIVEKLRETPRLLILDQVHSLLASSDRPLFVLADLWNQTKSPQLWCGTNDMIKACQQIKARGLNENMSQIRSRIAYARDLTLRTRTDTDGGRGEPLYSIDDVRRIFASNKIRLTETSVQMLYRMAIIPDGGGLRTVCNLVDVATIVAEARNLTEITVSMLADAMTDSMQPDMARTMAYQLRDSGVELPRRMFASAG